MFKEIIDSQFSVKQLFCVNQKDVSRGTLTEQVFLRKSDGLMDRLVCKWDEVTETGHHHIYSAGIDTSNHVYLDCRKRLIFTKILLSTAVRPLHCTVKTLYHLSMIPIVKAIFSTLRGQITVKEAFIKSVQSIADILRTPVYETAMIVVGIVALLSTPLAALIAPSTLYSFRKIIGKIEAALFRTQFHSFTLTPCFQSIKLRHLIENYGMYQKEDAFILRNFKDTDYGDYSVEKMLQDGIIEEVKSKKRAVYKIKALNSLSRQQKSKLRKSLASRSIIHYGRAMIKTQRTHYSPFYQLFGKLNPQATYVSLAHHKVPDLDKTKPSVKFDEVVIKRVINTQGQSQTEEKALNSNLDNVRHSPKSKTTTGIRSVFIEKINKKIHPDKKYQKRISYLVKSLANAFETTYQEASQQLAEKFSDKHQLKKTALQNFEKDVDKLLTGIENSTLEGKNLRRDGDALLPAEVKYKEKLKKNAIKYAKEFFLSIGVTPRPKKSSKKTSTKHGHRHRHRHKRKHQVNTIVTA